MLQLGAFEDNRGNEQEYPFLFGNLMRRLQELVYPLRFNSSFLDFDYDQEKE